MTTTTLNAPSIFDYLDLGLYLKDYYFYRKQLDKGFSYDAWAVELEFKSRSFLRMMIVGKKKLTPKVADAIQNRNFKSADEKNYFFYLTKYSQSGHSKEKQIYSQKMMQILKAQSSAQLIEDLSDFTSDPFSPRLLSLFSYEDVENTAPSFARILNVSEERVLEVLQIFRKLGIVEYNESTLSWSSKINTFKVPDNKGSLNLRLFHEKSLQEALRAFDLPKETRSYKSLILPMSAEDFQIYLRILDEFSSEQIHRHNSKTYKGKRLFQVNFNIYPVANALDKMTSK